MNDLKKQYKEHYEIYLKIIDSVNTTSQLINGTKLRKIQ